MDDQGAAWRSTITVDWSLRRMWWFAFGRYRCLLRGKRRMQLLGF